MTEEELKAIDFINYYKKMYLDNDISIEDDFKMEESMNILLNLVKKQQEEIEHQIEKRNNQKAELTILNEKQKEFNKLTNTVKSYEGQFKRQQKELKKLNKECQQYFEITIIQAQIFDSEIQKKDKIIDEMAKEMFFSECRNVEMQHFEDYEKIKQYFENKVEGSK